MKMPRDVSVKDVCFSFRAHFLLWMTCALLLLSLHGSAQNLNNDNYSKQAVDAAVMRQQHNYEMEIYQRYTGHIYKPYMGVSGTFSHFVGDIMPDKYAVTDLGILYGLNASIPFGENEDFLLNFYTLFGNLHSYHQDFLSAVDNLNFATRVAQFDFSLTYQYKLLFEIFRPYVRAGVGVMHFNPMGDLRDADGNYYLYPYPASYQGKGDDMFINYDKNYKTDLRRLNLYGDGNYARTTPIIPLEIGLGFKLGNFFFVRFGYMFTYTFTDLLDNVSGKTAREAQKIYPYEETRSNLNVNYLNYYSNAIAPQERAAALSANTANDMYGSFHITLQVRPFTSTRKVHNLVYAGSEMSDKEVVAYQKVLLDNDDENAPKSRFTPDKPEGGEVLKKKRIPRKFRELDSNGDGIISDIEMNDAIEQCLEGNLRLTRRDMTQLHKFYRSQQRR